MKVKDSDIIYDFDFRLDIDGSNLNHVNELIPVTELTKKNEIPEKLKS